MKSTKSCFKHDNKDMDFLKQFFYYFSVPPIYRLSMYTKIKDLSQFISVWYYLVKSWKWNHQFWANMIFNMFQWRSGTQIEAFNQPWPSQVKWYFHALCKWPSDIFQPITDHFDCKHGFRYFRQKNKHDHMSWHALTPNIHRKDHLYP